MTVEPEDVDPIDALLRMAESRRVLRAAVDSVPAMISYWDRDLRNVLANRAYIEWFGRTPEQMAGMHLRDLLGEEVFRLNHPHMLAVLDGEPQHFDRMLVDVSGATRYTHASYVPDVGDHGQVRGFFVLVTDVTARTQAEIQLVPLRVELERLATTDPLTGLGNRRELDSKAELALEAADRSDDERLVGLLLIDLDDFKPINDRLGHLAGDQLLVAVSRRLARAVREGDVVSRIGGDEFVVLMPRLRDAQAAARLADRAIGVLREPVSLGSGPGEPVRVTASIGVAVAEVGTGEISLRSLIREADRQMYLAKEHGGDRRSGPTDLPQSHLVPRDERLSG